MAKACKAKNRRGEPCSSRSVGEDGFCWAHTTRQLEAGKRFGSPQQAREAATGVERRFPRLREVTERRLEERADRIVDAQIEALDATRLTVSEDGDVHIHPDYLTRLRAGDTLMTRALGKPGSAEEREGPLATVNINLITDDSLRRSAADFRRRVAATRTVESRGLGAGS